jgi:Uma2 family endonuclease
MNIPLTLPRHKLTVTAFHKMGAAGVFDENSRIELIEGDLIDMAPIGSLHASVVNLLVRIFVRQVGESAIVSAQNPISLPPNNQPQPDIMLLKPRADWYRGALPTAADVLLIIEVVDTTLSHDRQIKIPLYARHGIAEAWLIDMQASVLEIYQEPSSKGYRKLLRRETKETVAPAQLPDVLVPLVEVWPG